MRAYDEEDTEDQCLEELDGYLSTIDFEEMKLSQKEKRISKIWALNGCSRVKLVSGEGKVSAAIY